MLLTIRLFSTVRRPARRQNNRCGTGPVIRWIRACLIAEQALFRAPSGRSLRRQSSWKWLHAGRGQVYVDTGVIVYTQPRPAFYRYLQALVDAGFDKRIMFGSDQMVWPETIERAIAVIDEAPFLSPEQKRDIFYNNAARFLRLDAATLARHQAMGSLSTQGTTTARR